MMVEVELRAPGWYIDGLRVPLARPYVSYQVPTTAGLEKPGVQVGRVIPMHFLKFNRTDRVTEDGLPIYELEGP